MLRRALTALLSVHGVALGRPSWRSHSALRFHVRSWSAVASLAGVDSAAAARVVAYLAEPGTDAAVLASQELCAQLRSHHLSILDDGVPALLAQCVHRVAACERRDWLVAILADFQATLPSLEVSDRTTQHSFVPVWDALAHACVGRKDAEMTRAVVAALVSHRGSLSPRAVHAFLTACLSSLAPKPPTSGGAAWALTRQQWGAVLDAALARCTPPVDAAGARELMAVLAFRGKVKPTFELFDLWKAYHDASGGGATPPELFEMLSTACRVARQPNRCLKVLKFADMHSVVPTAMCVEDVIVSLCESADVGHLTSARDTALAALASPPPDRPLAAAVVAQVINALALKGRNTDAAAVLDAAERAGVMPRTDPVGGDQLDVTLLSPPAVKALLLPPAVQVLARRARDGPHPAVTILCSAEAEAVVSQCLARHRLRFRRKHGGFVVTGGAGVSAPPPSARAQSPPPSAATAPSWLADGGDGSADSDSEWEGAEWNVRIAGLGKPRPASVPPAAQPVSEGEPGSGDDGDSDGGFDDSEVEGRARPRAGRRDGEWRTFADASGGNRSPSPRRLPRADPDDMYFEDVDTTRHRRSGGRRRGR